MKRVLYISIILLSTFSCKKQQEQVYYYENIDPRMKEFFFNVGSWWIYKNDSLEKTDSVYLWNVSTEMYDEYHGLNRHSIIELRGMNYDDELFPNFKDCIAGNSLMRNLIPGQSWPRPGVLYSFDTSYKHIDSLIVENVVYHDVQKCIIDSNIYYTAKGIGLIKKILYDSANIRTSWSLLRFKIMLTN